MSQGKEWNQEEVIEVLQPLLKLGYSVTKACNIAGIPQSTVATWINASEELRLKVNTWQNELSLQARKQWALAIKEGVPTKYGPDTYGPSKDWLERREKDDFSLKQVSESTNTNLNTEVEGNDEKPVEEKLKEVLSRIKALQDE